MADSRASPRPAAKGAVHRGHRHVKPFLDTILDLRSYRGAYSSVYAMESSSPAPSGRRARTQSFRPRKETTLFGSQLWLMREASR